MPLTLHRSNRLESLVEALAEDLRAHPAPPLEPERIVVASFGLRRWLSFRLAERLGVAMHLEFQLPSTFVQKVLAALSPEQPPSPTYQREVLPWRLHAALPGLLPGRDFAPLRNFVQGDPLKLWQLASQIAGVFDRYLAYRPDLLQRWEQGKIESAERWQAQLWQVISRGQAHAPGLLRQYAERTRPAPVMQDSEFSDLPLFAQRPARVAPRNLNLGRFRLFAPTALPPFYLQILEAAAPHADLQAYLLTPTQEYWGDILSEREKSRFRRWMTRRGANAAAHPLSDPHPLLASLGKIGREFHDALLDLSPTAEHDWFAAPEAPTTLLGRLQQSLLTLETAQEPRAIAANDRSLQIHNCHSPLREVEVLHDQLLALFEADPTLEPRDVLVSVTDMAVYAPCIEAVFDAPESEHVRFPFSIADRTAQAENPVADAFLRVLALVDSRFAGSAVLGLLDCEPVRVRFELSEADVPLIRDWVSRSGIRWGIDATHRSTLELPAVAEHTWRFGLDRLVLGFALPPEDGALFHGILPDEDIEGDLAETLGRFATFCTALFAVGKRLGPLEITAAEWTTELSAVVAQLCSGDDRLAEPFRAVMERLHTMEVAASVAGHRAPLPFRVMHSHVVSLFEDDESGAGFLRGGITFCSLKPMRAIPHRVVALLGLNDQSFPRATRAVAFDLAASAPLSGDRTLRDDDRYLFLETLLSARDTLLLSYCGQSAKDNSSRPPSVLVAELLDHLARHFRAAEPHPTVADQLTIRHCLQAFNARYFSYGERLFSYAQENARAAGQALGRRTPRGPFAADLPPQPVDREVPLTGLIEAVTQPAKWFARTRLQLALPYEDPPIEDSEPITLDGRERYHLSSQLTEAHLSDRDPTVLLPSVRAAGDLPHGYAGDSTFAEADAAGAQIATAIRFQAPGSVLPAATVVASVGEWTISGTLGLFTQSALVRHRAALVRPRDLLAAWISHLVLCAAAPAGYPTRTVVVGSDRSVSFAPMPAATATNALRPLLEIYERAHSEPVPFFAASAHALVTRLRKDPDNADKAWREAERVWKGDSFTEIQPESEDEWNHLVWQEHPEPLSREFARLAQVVFEPLLHATDATEPAPAKRGGTA